MESYWGCIAQVGWLIWWRLRHRGWLIGCGCGVVGGGFCYGGEVVKIGLSLTTPPPLSPS